MANIVTTKGRVVAWIDNGIEIDIPVDKAQRIIAKTVGSQFAYSKLRRQYVNPSRVGKRTKLTIDI